MNGNDNFEDGKSPEYLNALSALKNLDVEPSPYMKTRVLARAREAKEKSRMRFRWFYVFAGSCASAFVAAIVSFQMMKGGEVHAPENFMALNEPYMIKADLREMQGKDLAYVRVELDGQVVFASKRFANVSEMRSLTLSWENLLGKQYLPVVVKGTESGNSHVRVHFYDKENNLIKTQDFSLDFNKGTS